MIVYSDTKEGFINDVQMNRIEHKILASFLNNNKQSISPSEVKAWQSSMMYMGNVMSDPGIPSNAGVAIEYKVPQTSKRIDFILTGRDAESKSTAIIVELKQWSNGNVSITEKDGILGTNFFGEVSHPSYQVWSYASLLEDYNSNIQNGAIILKPCAYLHNYEHDDIVTNTFYKEYTDKAPVFLRPDVEKLKAFIKKFVKYGDNKEVLYAIDQGKICPSKGLIDSLCSMLAGNPVFKLIDEQKLVYETALKLSRDSTAKNKNVLIVEGGPGTGKSIVAINLLTAVTKTEKNSRYVTKNSAPREVFHAILTGKSIKTRFSNLFSSSSLFYNVEANSFDVLIVDEAHRLTLKSGIFKHLGKNQIKELINAAKLSIFFIDEDQRVTLDDIGETSLIKSHAKELGATVHNLKLASQYRCNGSDGYLAWIDNILQIRATANDSLEGINYDFRVIDSPAELHNKIIVNNKVNNKSRLLAGYCWKWISKKSPEIKDIVIGDFTATWNLYKHGQAFLIQPDSVNEVGCIHTCQGLELDYAGVIIGPDLVVRDGKIITDASKRASTDKSISGYKKMFKADPAHAKSVVDIIIKNTYRTLLTRGMKGCYVYCTDQETQAYFKSNLATADNL